MRLLAVLAAAALAGCLGQSVEPALPPVLDALRLSDPVRIDAEQPAREPAIEEAPDGTLFVAGFWGFARLVERPGTPQSLLQGPLVWRSADEGRSWQRLDPGMAAQGALSNSDLELAVADDGTLYLATLTYYSAPVPPGLPALPFDPATTLTVTIGASRDGGDAWTWTRLDQGSARSHPWVAVAEDGTAHVVWADGMGIRHATSDDRGASWTEQQRITGAGEAGGLVASGGALAVRVAPIGDPADGVATSEDGGETWTLRQAPGDRGGDEPRAFDSVAFDAAGQLYFVWNEAQRIRAARTADLGASWSTFDVAEEPEGTLPYFPYVRGGAPGELAVAWFARTDDEVAARVAHVRDAHSDAPRVRAGSFLEDTGGTNHADYYQVALLQDGGVAAAVPVTTSDLGQWFDYTVAR